MSDQYTCPFCGCRELSENTWHLDDAEDPLSEVDALECNSCKAGAPVEAWPQMQSFMDLVRSMRACQLEYFRSRDKGILETAKSLEKKVDQSLDLSYDPDLFGMEGL